MKKFYIVLALMVIMAVGGLFASCDKENNTAPGNATDLIGTWQWERTPGSTRWCERWSQLTFTENELIINSVDYLEGDTIYNEGSFNYQLTKENDIILYIPMSDNGDVQELKCLSVSNLTENQFTLTFYAITEEIYDDDGNLITTQTQLCNKGEHNTTEEGIYKRLQ